MADTAAVGVMPAPVLSPREIEVLVALAAGSAPKEIAGQLGITAWTVRMHIRTARRRLDARSTEQALLIAKDRRLLRQPAA
jgi:DNA-binding CsgD family transcriptional regulator